MSEVCRIKWEGRRLPTREAIRFVHALTGLPQGDEWLQHMRFWIGCGLNAEVASPEGLQLVREQPRRPGRRVHAATEPLAALVERMGPKAAAVQLLLWDYHQSTGLPATWTRRDPDVPHLLRRLEQRLSRIRRGSVRPPAPAMRAVA